MRRRILLMLLATISFVPKVVATIAVCSQCDSISEYSDLVSVIMGGSCGNSIGFGGDIRCTGNVGTLSRDLIIDGNQHSLTGNDVAAGIIVENANLTVKNIVNFENFKSASKGGAFIIMGRKLLLLVSILLLRKIRLRVAGLSLIIALKIGSLEQLFYFQLTRMSNLQITFPMLSTMKV